VRLREIKVQYGLSPNFEIKWTKVSPARGDFYQALLDYFFDDDDLHFRALVIPDKSLLDHARFNQDHDLWFFKMYFEMLKILINPHAEHFIYLDIKDTHGGWKVSKLQEVLANNVLDFDRLVVKHIQQVQSHEVEQIQIADLLIGAVSYANRGLVTSSAKLAFIQRMRNRSGHSLTRSTLPFEPKVNLLVWEAS
jgi:hypothetical protein